MWQYERPAFAVHAHQDPSAHFMTQGMPRLHRLQLLQSNRLPPVQLPLQQQAGVEYLANI